jgi:hypothetical protein
MRDSGRLGTQARKILEQMLPGVDYSRRELAQFTGVDLSSVCGRVNELIGSRLLKEGSVRACRVTGKKIKPVYKDCLF